MYYDRRCARPHRCGAAAMISGVFLENFAQALVAGLLVGAIYGLMCVGLGLIFGVMRVVNFAQGDFMMLGMYFTLYVVSGLGALAFLGPAAAPVAAALLAGPVLFAAGWAVHRLLLARVTGTRAAAGTDIGQAQLILTLGIALILENGGLIAFGSTPQTVHTPLSWSAWQIPLFYNPAAILFVNKARGIACLVSVVIGAALYWFIARTPLGKALRAAADNPEAATYMGIDVDRAYGLAFGIGSGITAIAGGMGSILGAFWGGMTIGLVQQLATLVLPLQLQNAAIFVVFLLIVQLWPQGLFGRSGERA